ncbi:hypothetical protein [Photorhabdus antumapuensis]|uniref:hypothetical protein n=1 Tax=Photorhabdus antumapuensis TaxID=2862867 RepID=UPI001CEC1A1F|nr:hypothetical protein [Photorhabdus antumapuensis]MCA6220437.1 hypothetical protein [Photorhabdus antumapuensis]
MNRITFIILLVSFSSFLLSLAISITIYKINQKKMDKIIELYIGKGLLLSTGVNIGRFIGVYGQFQVATFFYMLLTGKRMRINKPDSKYMYQESYDFIQNLPSSLTHWIKTYFITINISFIFFFISTVTALCHKYSYVFN